MKLLRKLLFISLSAGILIFSGCDDDYYDGTPPTPPTNLVTITGDNWVEIQWDYNRESDIAGYNVYYNYTYDGEYTLLGSTTNNYFVDYGAINGETYFYAVAAYDFDGYESELSYDYIYDTPRPEGFNRSVLDFHTNPNRAGYDFSEYSVIAYDLYETDFFFDYDNGVYYIDVWDDTDLQDMGSTYDIYDISEAPTSGWIPIYEGDNIKYAEAIPGHTYVIWTRDDHYAKIRISNIENGAMIFDWAYQTVPGGELGGIQLKRGQSSNSPEGQNRTLQKESR